MGAGTCAARIVDSAALLPEADARQSGAPCMSCWSQAMDASTALKVRGSRPQQVESSYRLRGSAVPPARLHPACRRRPGPRPRKRSVPGLALITHVQRERQQIDVGGGPIRSNGSHGEQSFAGGDEKPTNSRPTGATRSRHAHGATAEPSGSALLTPKRQTGPQALRAPESRSAQPRHPLSSDILTRRRPSFNDHSNEIPSEISGSNQTGRQQGMRGEKR